MLAYESHQSVEGVGAADYLKVEPKGPATRGRPSPLSNSRARASIPGCLLVQAAEDMSYESLCRSDHLTGLWGESKRPSLDTWTSLTVLAVRTRRIRFGPLVSPVTFYHPALLAKMAVALDTLSNGRLDLGLGGGWNEHEHAMFGFPLPPMKERLDRLEAAARYIRALGVGEPVTLEQPYYPLHKAENYPLPTHGRLRLVIGGRGEKRTLRIAAEFAD